MILKRFGQIWFKDAFLKLFSPMSNFGILNYHLWKIFQKLKDTKASAEPSQSMIVKAVIQVVVGLLQKKQSMFVFDEGLIQWVYIRS